MVLTAAEQPSAFCIIDEMFRGTNAPEKIVAVVEVLRYLARWKCFVLVATHDLEVPRVLHQQYRNFHFSEDVGAMGLSFDYTLKAGVATQRNAIKLLRHIGYPDEMVDNAAEIAELLVTEGVTTLIKE